MALTQDQWYTKLKALVPSWWFEKEKNNVAIFRGMAAAFVQLQQDQEDQLAQTFVTQATTPAEDALGAERECTRISSESDSTYASRIQKITSQTDIVSIKEAIDALLVQGESIVNEAPFDSPYCHRGAYCARDEYISGFIRDYFIAIIPKQVHAPYSFCGSGFGYFCGSGFGAYAGSLDFTSQLYASIIATVQSMKAFGVLWRLVVSNH